jgi:TetR/AcrR family fatty acid metabolism transcriptional regulator
VRNKSEQHDKILDAAGRLFGCHRFHEVRMEDIAAEAGVGKGTLYRYFNDKEELYLELLERASRQYVARLDEEKRRVEGPRAQLEAIVAAIVDFFDEQPHLFDLIQRAEVFREQNRAFPWQKARDELFRLLLQLFTEANDRGAFTVCDPELMELMLLGGLRSVIRFGKKPRPRNLAQRIVEAFLWGATIADKARTASGCKRPLLREPARV